MKKMSSRTILTVLLFGSLLMMGCAQPQGPERPTTYAVSGTVTHNGNPVEGATVNFQSATGANGAVGTTDATGKYTLTTFAAGDGAVPGEYKIKIVKFEGAAKTDVVDESSEDYVAPIEGQEDAPPKNLLPEAYADATTSGLTATVTQDAAQVFDFALEGEAK